MRQGCKACKPDSGCAVYLQSRSRCPPPWDVHHSRWNVFPRRIRTRIASGSDTGLIFRRVLSKARCHKDIGLFCWFNPVLLAYKKSIREIHEFMADHVAARHEASKAEYAMLLFSQQFGVIPSQLTNHFFDESMLKLRIKMLMKPRSPRTALYKYGFIAPLFG